MTTVTGYRIVKAKHFEDAFSGEGARLYGGRWNSPGKPCVYLSSSPSLAQLEILVHLSAPSLMANYRLLSIELSVGSVDRLETKDLPKNWEASPPAVELADIGDAWLSDPSASVALEIPSVMSPYPIETNYLLNTQHKDYTKLLFSVRPVDFRMDSRLRS